MAKITPQKRKKKTPLEKYVLKEWKAQSPGWRGKEKTDSATQAKARAKNQTGLRKSRGMLLVPHSVILMAGGDIELAMYLSNIRYWFTPNRDGEAKGIYELDGVPCLVKSNTEMAEECGLGLEVCRRRKTKAIKMGYIKAKSKVCSGLSTTHIIATPRFWTILEGCDTWLSMKHLPGTTKDKEKDLEKIMKLCGESW